MSASLPTRIWYQSFVHPVEQRAYVARLQADLDACAAAGVRFEVHGLSPPDRHLGALTEFRCAAQVIRNAIRAEEQGYDAFVLGHFQEPGLAECRTAVDIPVVSLGEGTMLHACTLGRAFGLVTINPVFVPWHHDQVCRLGLAARCAGVQALDLQVASFVQAFDDPAAHAQVKEEFVRRAEPLLAAGADVLIPAGGLPMLLLRRERDWSLGGAVVLDGIAVVVTLAEAAVKLRRLTGTAMSRRGIYARASAEAVREFLGILAPMD